MEFKPFNLGNALTQAENINPPRQTRQQNDSKQQIENTKFLHMSSAELMQNPGSISRIGPALRQRGMIGANDTWDDMSPDQIKQWATQQYQATGAGLKALNMVGKEQPNMIGKYNPGDYTPESWGEFVDRGHTDPGQLQRYNAPKSAIKVDRGDVIEFYHPVTNELLKSISKNLPKQETPEHKGDVVRAQEEAKQEVSRNDPQTQKAEGIRQTDAKSVVADIDSLLAPRRDGKGKVLSYAYGKENVLAPDMVKPQEWIDNEAVRDRIIANLQLENVQKLKGTGPITENEQKILKQAASALANPMISPGLAEKELRRVQAMIRKWSLGEKPKTPGFTNEDYEAMRREVLGR